MVTYDSNLHSELFYKTLLVLYTAKLCL